MHNKRVESTSKLIDEILLDAKKFYSLSESGVEAKWIGSLIKSDFRKLSSILKLISNEIGEIEKISLATTFIEYKKSITGGEFETISSVPISSTNQLYFDIDAV